MSTTLTGTDVDALSCAALDCRPQNYQWDGETLGGVDGWEFTAATRCETCGTVVIDEDHAEDCEAAELDALDLGAEGPMMNYWYPLEGIDRWQAARALVDLPLVAVEVAGETGLALSGGGMDLSWEICEAFMLLGFLPPLHFTDLPGMAGRGQSESDKAVVAACQRSNRIASERAERRIARLAAI